MKKSIGAILRECRNSAGFSVQEISALLTDKGYKASIKTIYSWETGNSQPSPDELLEMCDAYKVRDILKTFGYDGLSDDGDLRLSINEQSLVSLYRTLDFTDRARILERMETMLEADKYQTEDKRQVGYSEGKAIS